MWLEVWLPPTAIHPWEDRFNSSTTNGPCLGLIFGNLDIVPHRRKALTLALLNNSLLWELWAPVTWVILIQVQNLTYLSLEIDVRSLENKFLHTVYVTSVGGDHEECGAMLGGGQKEEQSGQRMPERGPGGEAAETSAPLRACPSTKLPTVMEVS